MSRPIQVKPADSESRTGTELTHRSVAIGRETCWLVYPSSSADFGWLISSTRERENVGQFGAKVSFFSCIDYTSVRDDDDDSTLSLVGEREREKKRKLTIYCR